jgi:hypothetical protein
MDAVQRLRASKEKSVVRNYRDGLTQGKRWAEQLAEADELESLERMHNRVAGQSPDWPWYFEERHDNYPAKNFVSFCGIDMEVPAFWHWALSAVGPTAIYENGDFVRGFADGALEAWALVKPQL